MEIYQGCTYKLPIKLTINGKAITNKDVQTVEFAFDENVTKKYPDEVTFDGEYFICPLTQEDTNKLLHKGQSTYQARIKFNDGSVKPTKQIEFEVMPSISKAVL